MSVEKINDDRLLQQYLSGESSAINALLARYQDRVFTSIYLKVRCHALAQDIMQETFIKVVRTIDAGKYKEDGRFYQWMMRISYNLCIDHFRKVKRRPSKVRDDKGYIMSSQKEHSKNKEESLILDEKCKQVQELIDELPPEQREVVVLRHYSDLSFKEIAELTGVSINTALGRMRYALNNMRKKIEDKSLVIY